MYGLKTASRPKTKHNNLNVLIFMSDQNTNLSFGYQKSLFIAFKTVPVTKSSGCQGMCYI